jgi:hypothetical protein
MSVNIPVAFKLNMAKNSSKVPPKLYPATEVANLKRFFSNSLQ